MLSGHGVFAAKIDMKYSHLFFYSCRVLSVHGVPDGKIDMKYTHLLLAGCRVLSVRGVSDGKIGFNFELTCFLMTAGHVAHLLERLI